MSCALLCTTCWQMSRNNEVSLSQYKTFHSNSPKHILLLPLHTRNCGLAGWAPMAGSDECGRCCPPPARIRSPDHVQPVASRYWAVSTHGYCNIICKNSLIVFNLLKPNDIYIYRVFQEEWTKRREGVPYVELYRYNQKHLYPKLNGYGDNGQRSLKLWQLLHTYWLPNTYWNWKEYVVSVMLISVLNIKLTCEWHKAIKLNYKNTRTTVVFVLRFPSTRNLRRPPLSFSRQGHCITMLASGFSLPGMCSGWVWCHGRRTVRGRPRSPHFSMAVISVTVQLWV